MKLILCKTREDAGERLADTLAFAIVKNPHLKLGLSAGRTSILCYTGLVQRFHERGGFSFRHVTAFGTDEYVGLTPNDHRSTRYLMNFHLFRQVDIPREQTFVPRGDAKDLDAECKAWDMLIEAREVLLIATGLGKADALHKMMEGRSGPSVPASLLLNHPKLTIFADRDATSRLDDDSLAKAEK